MKPLPKKSCSIALAFVLLGVTNLALAQYVWTDAKGSKQYSDMPPPSSVPRSHILKQPGGTTPALVAPVDDDGKVAPGDPAVKSTALMTIAERNADFQKRKMEQAEKDKKVADAAKAAADKAANCDKMQSYGRALEDGIRISNTDKNGERSYMSDEQRAAEIQKNQRAVRECK